LTLNNTVMDVAVGQNHACGFTVDGNLWCWGDNTYGALGNGTTAASPVPVPVAGGGRYTTITAGLHHTCAIARNGGAWCWGIRLSGQTGTHDSIPAAVGASIAWRTLSTGEGHTCGTAHTGGAYCWGASLGPADDGSVAPPRTVPTLTGSSLTAVSVGYEIACALNQASTALCWGLQPPGVVLTSGLRATDSPKPVTSSPAFASISAGHKHACGLDAGGAAWCWGLNGSGQVGDGTTDTAAVPVPVVGGHSFTAIDAHAPGHSCGIAISGAAWCWGANHLGQLGDGTGQPATAPVAVAGGLAFTSISVGFHFTCGVAGGPGAAAYCWGYGGLGQLGDGASTDRAVPVRVASPPQ
jgi:alpha-tubulin suppressor-like RCC1 family protein